MYNDEKIRENKQQFWLKDIYLYGRPTFIEYNFCQSHWLLSLLWWYDSDRYQALGHDLVSSLVFIIINIRTSQDRTLQSQLTINIK